MFSEIKRKPGGESVLYTNGVISRNKIKKGRMNISDYNISDSLHRLKINDVPLPRDKKWMDKHWKAIKQNYSKADYFRHYRDFFEGLFKKDFEYLWQVSMEIISYLLKCFVIDTEVITTN